MDAGASALRVIGGLIFTLGLFFAGLWVARNWQRLGLQRGRSPKLRVMETRALGNRQALHVIKYQNQLMLVAASPAGVALLRDLGEAPPEEEAAAPVPLNFAQALSQALTSK